MIDWVKTYFVHDVETLKDKRLREAQVSLEEHTALAEYHVAIAEMLKARIARLAEQRK